MIAFAIARAKRILLVSFSLPVTRETLQRLDAERSTVMRREGAMDMIVDFTDSPAVVIPSRLTHERVGMPSPMPGFRRVYVAPRDELFGSLRMYAIPHDDPRVESSAAWTWPSPRSACLPASSNRSAPDGRSYGRT